MVNKREQAISGALEMGANIEQINNGLINAGQKPLSEYETTLINRDRYGQNLLERFASGAKDFGSGLSSLGGAVFQYRDNPIFRNYINKQAGNYLKDVVTGNTNPYEDFANLVLTPYGTDVKKFVSNPIQGIKDIGYNAAADPFNAALDLTTFTPKGTLANIASKLDIPVVNDIRRVILPTAKEKQVNNLINLASTSTATNRIKMAKELENIALDSNINQAVKNLTYGSITPETKDITNRLKQFSEKINKQMVDLGVDAGEAKKVAVGQYVLEQLDPKRTNKIYLQNVQKAIDNPTIDNVKAIGLNSPTELNALVEKGSKAFDDGLIFPISQRGIKGGYDKTLVDLTDIGKGLSTQRTFGYATPEQVASYLDTSYGQLFKEIETAQLAKNNIEELASKFGRGITPDEVNKIAKSEVIISPTEFKDGVKTLFNTGKQSELGTFAKQFSKGASNSSIKKYANDLYAVDKNDLRALANATAKYDVSTPTGKIIQAAKPIMGAFKGSVLAKVPYVAGNRIGNLSLAAIGGADYLTALKPGNIEKYIPDYLKFSTSFHGLNPGFESSNIVNTYKDTTRNLKRGFAELTNKELSPSERIAGAGTMIKAAQDYAVRPLFQSESTLELIDRAAVYFNEAKKYARQTGTTMEDVLNKALTDKDLQKDLISRVNNILGDYIGRNSYVNPNAYELMSLAFPFHKVITTSKDILINQLRDNPLKLQAFARIPSRYGNQLEAMDEEIGGQPRDNDIRGGLVINPTYTKREPALKVFNDYNPLIAPFETLQSVIGPEVRPGEGTGLAGAMNLIGGNLNPVAGLFNVMKGLDQYGNPVVGPNTYTVGNKVITLDNNGNRLEQPSPDILGAMTGYIGRNFLPLATFYNQTIGPSIGHLSGKGFYQPTNRAILGSIGDTNIPYLMEGNTKKAPIKTLRDLTRQQLGFKTRDVYYPYTPRLNTYDLENALRKKSRNEFLLMNRGF
jgi:hypothetical protein